MAASCSILFKSPYIQSEGFCLPPRVASSGERLVDRGLDQLADPIEPELTEEAPGEGTEHIRERADPCSAEDHGAGEHGDGSGDERRDSADPARLARDPGEIRRHKLITRVCAGRDRRALSRDRDRERTDSLCRDIGPIWRVVRRRRTGAFADELRDIARLHHGHAARVFLQKLTEHRATSPDKLRDTLNSLRDAFLDRHVPKGATGQVRSVAGRFALIATAGELARDYGVLPWPEGEALRAAGACLSAWLEQRGGSGPARGRCRACTGSRVP